MRHAPFGIALIVGALAVAPTILGAKIPKPFDDGWRVFYTRQHGDNQFFEIIPNPFARGAEHASDNEDD